MIKFFEGNESFFCIRSILVYLVVSLLKKFIIFWESIFLYYFWVSRVRFFEFLGMER